ncbi:MAG: rod shape-determining protein MreC [Elusimicrobiaceae bacterium]|nr:rod shape-determining protein MreC [Elusimicrobiaceae bacterium]
MQRKNKRKMNVTQGSRRRKILPVVFLLLSLFLMILPLESPVASVKAILSYVFIPQIRAAHGTVEYAGEVNQTVQTLLNVHQENERLKEEMEQLRLENAQAKEIMAENERLTASLQLSSPQGWSGIWAKTAYREPTQWNSVIIDKGTSAGVQERAAAIALKDGVPVLVGVVIECAENTAKVLLLQDEDFSAAVYALPSKEEGLISGSGSGLLKMQYLSVLSQLQKGEKVYTSSSSTIFPSGILVGEVEQVEKEVEGATAPLARVIPAANASLVRELFILIDQKKKVNK